MTILERVDGHLDGPHDALVLVGPLLLQLAIPTPRCGSKFWVTCFFQENFSQDFRSVLKVV